MLSARPSLIAGRTLCGSAWVQSTADGLTTMFAGARLSARIADESCSFLGRAVLQSAVDAYMTAAGSFAGGGSSLWDHISDWDVSRISSMAEMFHSASTFNRDLSWWDVGQVTDMQLMFREAPKFNQPLNSWDVGQIKNMQQMFM